MQRTWVQAIARVVGLLHVWLGRFVITACLSANLYLQRCTHVQRERDGRERQDDDGIISAEVSAEDDSDAPTQKTGGADQ